MSQPSPSRPIERPLRAFINRVAHARALQYEARIKASLLARMQAARDGGASDFELQDMVCGLGQGLTPHTWPLYRTGDVQTPAHLHRGAMD